MRVIAGTAKGIKLKNLEGMVVRPTSDRVKESLFNILGSFWQGGQAADLFAGSGALGIEAISRGISRAIFVEKNRRATKIIKANLQKCHFSEQAHILPISVEESFTFLQKWDNFDLIFLDPPYRADIYKLVITQIINLDLLKIDGYLVAEHDAQKEMAIPLPSGWQKRVKTYGSTALTIIKR